MDEIKELLQAILHRVELNGAKIDALTEAVARLEGQNLRQDRRLDDHNHRIADIEQEIRISKQ